MKKSKTLLVLLTLVPTGVGEAATNDCVVPAGLSFWDPLRKDPTAITPTLRQSVGFTGGGTKVVLFRSERATSTASWEVNKWAYTTDMKLVDVVHRDGGNELYVAGIRETASGCESVVEQWKLGQQNGMRYMRYPGSGTRGTPSPTPFIAGVSVGVTGPAYVPMAERRFPQPPVTKTVLFSGNSIGTIARLEADPEGRFLLMQSHDTGNIYSIDPSAVGVPVLEFSAATIPALADADSLNVLEHETLGRFYILENFVGHVHVTGASTKVVILKDTNNDGVFDGHEVIDNDGVAWKNSPWNSDSDLKSLVNAGVATE